MSCKYCSGELDILAGVVDEISSDIFISGDSVSALDWVESLHDLYTSEKLRVFIDRGYLRITIGDDIGCLDHSVDRVKANYCFHCGAEIA